MASNISCTHAWLREFSSIDMGNHSLNNNNSRVDYHTKVYGSETHQVAVNTKRFHQGKGKEHTQWNNACHHESGTPITQKQHQHKDNNESTCYEVVCNGTFYSFYQISTVNKRFDNHTFW